MDEIQKDHHHKTLEHVIGETVSRETMEKLCIYARLLQKWQPTINLVSNTTLPHLWERHIIDSAQLVPFLPPTGGNKTLKIVDMGSGGGFPGLILALMTSHHLHLVESDSRKIAFLRTVIRETGCSAQLHPVRVESLPFMNADMLTARALASLQKLLELSKKQHHAGLSCLFMKGRTADSEKEELTGWSQLNITAQASKTDPQGQILQLKNF